MKKPNSSNSKFMATVCVLMLIVGAGLVIFGGVGHFWHKYFSAIGRTRFQHFPAYMSEHAKFYVSGLAGFALVHLGSKNLEEDSPDDADGAEGQ